MRNPALYTSHTPEWATPLWLYTFLDRRFHFTLDPCATEDNAKCDLYSTKEDDGLAQPWGDHRVFMNPPYGNDLPFWIRKAHDAALQGALVVALIPARTDTTYWNKYVMAADEVIFIEGRIKFGGQRNSAPFPSAIIVFRPGGSKRPPAFSSIKAKSIQEVIG